MKFKRLIYVVMMGAVAFFSCNKSENAPMPDMNLAYFPLKLTSVVVYNVDSTVYSDFNNSVTTFNFQLKDTVTNTFIDAQGNEAFRIERYKKIGTQDWTFQKVIAKKIVNNRAEEYLDNRRYVRLVFPPTLQARWNGNVYNNLGEWTHEITAMDVPLTIGAKTLDSTISIKQYEEVNLIREDIYSEIYAKHIGLVKKEVKAVDKNINNGQIRRGYAYRMQVASWK
ncbi:hypothetical protein [Nubsella zeaxanthinifaciens]|uniref:hypothetical protein n=1 Tax=Nubsella zeaxanthinifaciens TaxID=392412 RepID=UPI00130033A1|nr:hypothetical protein [Nubsella zeaxanthinifaciens]